MCRHIKRHGRYIGVPQNKMKWWQLPAETTSPVGVKLFFLLSQYTAVYVSDSALSPQRRCLTTPEEFENVSLFLPPTVHNNLSRKRGFSKMLFKPEEFSCGQNTFWKQSFSKTMTVVTRMDTLKSGWSHYVYYTIHQMMRVQVYITFCFGWTCIIWYVV